MILNILNQLVILDSRTLEENIRLCGQLEQAVKRWQLWRRLAQGVHLLLFAAAGSSLMVMTWVESLMEAGRSAEIPSMLNPVFPRMLTEADIPANHLIMLNSQIRIGLFGLIFGQTSFMR